MGTIVNLRCDNCDYEKDIQLGSGMMDYSAAGIVEHFTEEKDAEARSLLSEPDVLKQWRYDRVLGQCPSCKRIASVPILTEKTGAHRRVGGGCVCGGMMRLWILPDDAKRQSDEMPVCPDCGGALVPEQVGFWD